jgi:uncharacterized membrane protein
MASGIVGARQGKSSRHGRPFTGASAGGPMQDLGWIPIALGAAAIVARLGGRKKGAAALALTAVAGAAAVGAVRGVQHGRGRADSKGQGASDGKPEVERSITIGKTADELRHYWLDPRTLPQIMAGFATVHAAGDGRMHWKVEGPLGRLWEWDSETVDRPGEGIGWRSLPDGAISNEGWVRFQSAPAGRGTVLTLRVRFDAPGGALGGGVLKLLGTTPLDLVADGALRRFKNLVETGEIPTTVRQPAARADTH